jgi:hypothetical protein
MKTTHFRNAILAALLATGLSHVALGQGVPTEADTKIVEKKKPDYSPSRPSISPRASSGATPITTAASRSTPA